MTAANAVLNWVTRPYQRPVHHRLTKAHLRSFQVPVLHCPVKRAGVNAASFSSKPIRNYVTSARLRRFQLLNYRTDMVFALVHNGTSAAPVVSAISAPITVANPNEVTGQHLTLTTDPGCACKHAPALPIRALSSDYGPNLSPLIHKRVSRPQHVGEQFRLCSNTARLWQIVVTRDHTRPRHAPHALSGRPLPPSALSCPNTATGAEVYNHNT